ncbi:MAG: hypothetical protein P8Y53_06690 [Pseudolabrys sp.]
MSEQVMNSAAKPFLTRAAVPWPLAMAAIFYLLLLLLGGCLLGNADTYWQIALGQWIAAHHQVPHVDTLSFTMAGKPWISSQWLAQVIFAGVYAVGAGAAWSPSLRPASQAPSAC